jgi:nucleotide-binding universal stress UspA family protein
MFRSILVPLDGSIFAEQALPLAASIARHAGAVLRLVRVIPPLADYFFWAPLPGDPLETDLRNIHRIEAQEYLNDVVQRVRAAGTVSVVCDVIEEKLELSVAESIGVDAEKKGVDLVVLTSHGRGAVARFWLGSVADKLVRSLKIPVLLVRPQESAGPPDLAHEATLKHLLLALDGTTLAEQILEPAVAIGKAMGAEYTLVRAIRPAWPFTPLSSQAASARPSSPTWAGAQTIDGQQRRNAENYLESVAKRLRSDGAVVHTRVHIAEQPATAILEEAAAVGADLIALETHGRGGLSRMLLGSVADKVVRGSSHPVLVCRLPEKTTPAA